MIALRKRGEAYHVDLLIGRVHAVRGALGTRNRDAALRLVHRLELALSEGPRSKLWSELRPLIPHPTFVRFKEYVGVEERLAQTWKDFRDMFESYKRKQLKTGELAIQTLENYQRTLTMFETFLAERNIQMLQDINARTIDDFSLWRINHATKANSTGGVPSLHFDLRHLHHVFGFAYHRELLDKNPVKAPPNRCDRHISRPYSADEVVKWEDAARHDQTHVQLFPSRDEWLPLWLLRWTGFRPRDAVTVLWQEFSPERKQIEHVCHKNHNRVIIPIVDESLLAALDAERKLRNPRPSEPILLNPKTDRPFTCYQLWVLIVDLGKRAGVPNASPYRFRGTFAIDMLIRSNNPYYVARLLGDSMAVVERHYAPYVRELQEHNRMILQGGTGLGQFVTPTSRAAAERR